MVDGRSSSLVRLLIPLATVFLTAATTLGQSLVTVESASSDPLPGKRSVELGVSSDLPLPSTTSVSKYEAKLFEFLNSRKYMDLKWNQDKSIRDTGPYIDGKYYGTHPAVRVFYSPEVIEWLMNGRKGPLPDGAMICKEQYEEPAARHDGKTEEELRKSLKSWTVMIKDSNGSHDGWYWANPGADQEVTNNHKWPFDHPLTGFGHYCVRCHAATHSPGASASEPGNEFTFSALRNIKGFPGEPIVFRVDDSWRKEAHEAPHPTEPEDTSNEALLQVSLDSRSHAHPRCTQTDPPDKCRPELSKDFLRFYGEIGVQQREQILPLPPVTHDWVPNQNDGQQELATSNQCMSCHAGLVAPFGPSMFVPTGESTGYGEPGWHVSPYGEWRWTPMGLAGRDPIFFSQVESEVELLKKQFANEPGKAKMMGEELVNTCLRCHGAMGHRQFHLDNAGTDKKFTVDHVYATAGKDEHLGLGNSKYGALARDGISCMVCHRSQPREQPADDTRPYLQFFLENSITGNYSLGKRGEIYGPFKDDEISPYVMEHGIGIKPKHSEYLKSSQMCGTCHTVNLPTVDHPFEGKVPEEQKSLVASEQVEAFKGFYHHIEQATYLEWLNSDYENEFSTANPNAKSCQDCHMSKGLHDEENGIHLDSIQTRIAAVQDRTYPDAENLIEHKELDIRIREEGYSRHNFSGLNVFLVELFNQFDDILGVRKHDFMTGSRNDVKHAIDNFVSTARNDVADLGLKASLDGRKLTATVDIVNKVGHRFPSGVGFRRAFIELVVAEKPSEEGGEERIVWSSGRTNSLGIIIGPDGQPLPTEFFDRDEEGGPQCYQPHHETITGQDQVQIYETLLHTHEREFTTSFIHGCYVVKENRLLPKGWSKRGPDPAAMNGEYLTTTYPGEKAKLDSRYTDGSGTDETRYEVELPAGVAQDRLVVRASLFYQAIPPYFLKNLFENAPEGPATRRLHYMLSNVKLEGTVIEGWKLKVASVEEDVK